MNHEPDATAQDEVGITLLELARAWGRQARRRMLYELTIFYELEPGEAGYFVMDDGENH